MKRFTTIFALLLLLVPSLALADDVSDLKKKVDKLYEEIDYLQQQIDKNTLHSATDRISFYGDMRVKADTLHYQDTVWNPAVNFDFDSFMAQAMADPTAWGFSVNDNGTPADPSDDFFNPGPIANFAGPYGLTPAALGSFSGVMPFPLIPGRMGVKPPKSDLNNDILYTTRLRLGMKAKVADNVNFSARLSMYKNWGDSTGVKVFDSWNAFTMDGTDGGNTTGDWLRVERAYFSWHDIGGSNFYLSIGRRPSTYGPPSEVRENEMRGGTPSGHLVHFNFDGVTIGYKLADLTGIEGMTARFCYGQGFESQWGNGELYDNYGSNIATEDTHLGGLNLDLYNDGSTFVQLTAFAALDVVDGFKGVFAFPSQLVGIFAPTLYKDQQKFPGFNFVTRYQPSTVIGDMLLGGIGFEREEENGLKYFGSFGWTELRPNGKAGLFGGMGTDAIFEPALSADGNEIILVPVRAENDDTQDGYGIYVGLQIPAPLGKFGVEYNYGSKYWTPFTQAQDDALGSKLATRGHVGEAYYIFDINPNMFIKVGGLYYDYEYTGSGSPVGKPVKVDDVLDGKAYSMLPVSDTAWDGYASLTLKF